MKKIEQFLELKTANQTESSAHTYRNFYNRVEAYFPEGKTMEQLTKDDFIRILSNLNTKAVGNFTVAKSNLKDYVEWMVQQGCMNTNQLYEFSNILYDDLDHSNSFMLYYFKNFNELYSVLEQTIGCHLGENEENGEFDTLRCAVYLSWYGFTLEELTIIKKSDVSFRDCVIYKGLQRVPIRIGDNAMSYIRNYAERESYRSRKSGRADGVEMRYKNSEFLFRSCKSDRLTVQQINAMTRYTNPYADEVGKRFAFGKINQSGIYYRIYLDEQENGELKKNDYERIARLFGISDTDLQIQAKKYDLSARKYVQYHEYKKAFYGGK